MKLHNGCLFCFLSFLINTVVSQMEKELLEHLLTNYSSLVRPVRNPHTVVNVTFQLKLFQVLEVNEKAQTVKIHGQYVVYWRNELLRWNPREWAGIHHLTVVSTQVWVPTIIQLNKADDKTKIIQDESDAVWLYYDGWNYWYPKVVMTASFNADIKFFPFDIQEFSFWFESWNFESSKLRILNNGDPMIDREHYVNSTEWQLLKTECNLSLEDYQMFSAASITMQVSRIKFTYTFERKSSYFVMTLIVPIIILMMVVLFSYFLPAASGERMGVLITILLAFAVFLEVISSSLPQDSNSSALLSIYILAIMSECALSFFVTCLVKTLLHKGNEGSPPPGWVQRCFHKSIKENGMMNRWMRYDIEAQHFNAVCGSCNEGVVIKNEVRMQESVNMQEPINLTRTRKRETMNGVQEGRLSDILAHLKMITTEQENTRKIQMQWVYLANTIDKISFWFFLCIFSASQSILIVAYYRQYD